MTPDHLAAQLLTSGDGVADKVERNTQGELLVVLATILTWRANWPAPASSFWGIQRRPKRTSVKEWQATSTRET